MRARDFSIAVLVGGDSTRMGFRKAELELDGRRFIEHIQARLAGLSDDVLVVGAGVTRTPTGTRQVGDLFPAKSPLVGIYSGLVSARSSRCLVVACDMPMVNPELVRLLGQFSPDADATVPSVRGYLEPLCAIYHTRVAPTLWSALDRGVRKVTAAISELDVAVVPEELVRSVDPTLATFTNVNSPRDLAGIGYVRGGGPRRR